MRIRASTIQRATLVAIAVTACTGVPPSYGSNESSENHDPEVDPPAILASPDDLIRMRLQGEKSYYRYLGSKSEASTSDKPDSQPIKPILQRMVLPAAFECWQNRILSEVESTLLAPDIVSKFGNSIETEDFPLRFQSAKRDGHRTTCTVEFTVTKAGEVKDLKYVTRSTSIVFDGLVAEAVLKLKGKQVLQFPHKITSDTANFKISITRRVYLAPWDGKLYIRPGEDNLEPLKLAE